ncbi:MAG: PEP/pyruvate-binding domain-containing protein, partial [Myxococcota bacterium]
QGEYGKKLTLIARLYRAVCNTMPSAQTFHDHYFTAYGAKPQIADVIYALESDAPPISTLQTIVVARQAIRHEIGKHDQGYERMSLWELDQKLELLSSSYLGGLVESVGKLETPEQLNDAMGAMKLALEGALLSGLDQIRDTSDPMSSIGPTLNDALADIHELFDTGQVSIEDYRNGIAQAYEAIVKATENIRTFVDSRVPDVSLGRLIPNPGFMDDFIKEGPLHYARAIAQKAMTVGLEQELSAKRVVNPDGVSILNNLGKVVFDRIIVADNMAQLRELNAGPNDFCIVKTLDEKKMIAVGGVMAPFPGGYCHAAVYARGAGMAALSNPTIGKVWQDFARNLGDDKLFYDDSGGQIVMMPFKEAVKQGLVKEADADKLHPGSNREVDFLSWDDAEQAWKTIGHHTVTVHPDRPTRHIEIFTPSGEVNGLGSHVLTGDEAGALGINGRGLGGEKNTVLAMMAVHPVLEKWVVPNSYISTLQCYKLLDDAGVLEAWRDVFDKDSVVIKITDENFMQSQLYTDAEYRTGVRKRLSAMVHSKVMKHFIGDDGKPTDAGKALLVEMRRNPELSGDTPLIIRSSFSAEDRPFKSGAGQYDSFPNRKTDAEILEAVMGVIASYWQEAPIENNVTQEYNLEHIAPAVGINKSLHAKYSGVMFSRARDGKRRTAAYQAVEGFGGGVEEGKTEMGELTKDGNKLERTIPGLDKSIIDPGIEKELWEMAMEVEKFFHEQVEAGKGFAVDIEWVYDEDDEKLYIVQARTVQA